jgi:heptosyltransferase-2
MKNILIIKTGSIGDVLRTTCIIEGLIEKYLNPRIFWLTSEKSLDTISNNPFIKEIFVLENLNKKIFNLNFDLVISLEEDKKCLEVLSKLRKNIIFGVYEKEGKIEYTKHASYWYNMSLVSKFGKNIADELKKSNLFSYPEILYKMLGLKWNKQKPRLFLKDNTKEKSIREVNPLESPEKIIIGLVVGAGGRWPLKVLPVDLQIKLIKKIKKELKDKVEILLITGPSALELNATNNIKKKLPFVKTHEIVDLNLLFGVISLCDIIITPDTLSMHIAISLNKYVLAYFTVTSAPEIEMYHGEKIITKDKEFYCSYSTENTKRPNVTDKIDLDKIVYYVKRAVLR